MAMELFGVLGDGIIALISLFHQMGGLGFQVTIKRNILNGRNGKKVVKLNP